MHRAPVASWSLLLACALAGPALADGPTPLTSGVEVEGTLARGDTVLPTGEPADRYTIEAAAGQRVVAVARSEAFAPKVVLVDPDRQPTAARTGKETTVEAVARVAGRFTVMVVGEGSMTAGRYTLRVTVGDGAAAPPPATADLRRPTLPPDAGGLEGLWGRRDGQAWVWWAFDRAGWVYAGVPPGGVDAWAPGAPEAAAAPRDPALGVYAVRAGRLVVEQGPRLDAPFERRPDGTAAIGGEVFTRFDVGYEGLRLDGRFVAGAPGALTLRADGTFTAEGAAAALGAAPGDPAPAGPRRGRFRVSGSTLVLEPEGGPPRRLTLGLEPAQRTAAAPAALLLDGTAWTRD